MLALSFSGLDPERKSRSLKFDAQVESGIVVLPIKRVPRRLALRPFGDTFRSSCGSLICKVVIPDGTTMILRSPRGRPAFCQGKRETVADKHLRSITANFEIGDSSQLREEDDNERSTGVIQGADRCGTRYVFRQSGHLRNAARLRNRADQRRAPHSLP